MCCFTLLRVIMGSKARVESKRRDSRNDKSVEEQMKTCCPYAILGIHEKAEISDIKQARNKKLKIHHPDKLTFASRSVRKNSEELSKRINWAYEELSSKRLRA